MAIIQLAELIRMETPQGPGWAILMEASAHEYFWTICLDEGGALVTFPQDRVRVSRSYTHGRISDAEMRRIVKSKHPQRKL